MNLFFWRKQVPAEPTVVGELRALSEANDYKNEMRDLRRKAAACFEAAAILRACHDAASEGSRSLDMWKAVTHGDEVAKLLRGVGLTVERNDWTYTISW